MPTVNIFELRKRFRKSVEYLWRYRIFAGTGYRLKVAKFQMLSKRKVFTLPRYFTFAMARWRVCARQHLIFCHFQHVQCASKNPLSPKVLNRFSKSLHQLEGVESGHLGGQCQVRSCFTFAMARWKLCASTPFEILPLSTCVLCQQKSYISKVLNKFSKSLLQLEDVEGAHLGGKSKERRYFILQWQGENFAHWQHLKLCHFQHVQCASKNPISPKVLNRC